MQLANQVADLFFYDVGALEHSEWRMLQPTLYGKGTTVVLSPRAAPWQHRIRHYTNSHSFMREERDRVQAIAVAGAGNSTLGATALARNIADCTDGTWPRSSPDTLSPTSSSSRWAAGSCSDGSTGFATTRNWPSIGCSGWRVPRSLAVPSVPLEEVDRATTQPSSIS
jgi:hypothetical protein